MFFLRFITQVRFSYLDYVWLSAFFMLFVQHRFLLAFLAFFVGVLFSAYLEKRIRDKDTPSKDAVWQESAKNGFPITAIKLHRQLYGSSLKEAKDAVDAYIQKT